MKKLLLLLLVPILWACPSDEKDTVEPKLTTLAGTNWRADQYKIFTEPATDAPFYKTTDPNVNFTWTWQFADNANAKWQSSNPNLTGSLTYTYSSDRITFTKSGTSEFAVKEATKNKLHVALYTMDENNKKITEEIIFVPQ